MSTCFRRCASATRRGETGGHGAGGVQCRRRDCGHAFLAGRIGFSSIPVVVERTLHDVTLRQVSTVDDVFAADEEARSVATGHLGDSC